MVKGRPRFNSDYFRAVKLQRYPALLASEWEVENVGATVILPKVMTKALVEKKPQVCRVKIASYVAKKIFRHARPPAMLRYS